MTELAQRFEEMTIQDLAKVPTPLKACVRQACLAGLGDEDAAGDVKVGESEPLGPDSKENGMKAKADDSPQNPEVDGAQKSQPGKEIPEEKKGASNTVCLPGPTWPLDSHPDRVREFLKKWGMDAKKKTPKQKVAESKEEDKPDRPSCWNATDEEGFVAAATQAPPKRRGRKKAKQAEDEDEDEADCAADVAKEKKRESKEKKKREKQEPEKKEVSGPKRPKKTAGEATTIGKKATREGNGKDSIQEEKPKKKVKNDTPLDKGQVGGELPGAKSNKKKRLPQNEKAPTDLEKKDEQPNEIPSKRRRSKKLKTGEAENADGSVRKREEAGDEGETEGHPAPVEDKAKEEAKKKRSKMCVAYNAARKKALEKGRTEEEAKAAAREVSQPLLDFISTTKH